MNVRKNNSMILYFIFLFILILLWLLFVYNLKVDIFFSLDKLEIKLFKIRIINLVGNKYKEYLTRFIPKSKEQIQEEMDLTFLLSLIHYDVVELKICTNINDFTNLMLVNSLVYILHEIFDQYINSKVDKYTYIVEKEENVNLLVSIKCNLNIGVILINYLIIKRRYRHAKTNK